MAVAAAALPVILTLDRTFYLTKENGSQRI
jgi:hypothetical protein